MNVIRTEQAVSRSTIAVTRIAAYVIAALVVILPVATSVFAADPDPDLGPAPGSYRITAEDGVVRFPFELFRGDVRFSGKVNGQEVRMLIDNGYLWNEILFFGSPRVDSLGLEYDGEIDVGGSGDGEPVPSNTASGINISFAGIEFYDQSAIITPYSSGMANMWWGCEGQVSATFFKHFVVSFDFDRMLMTLTEPDKFQYSGTGVELPMVPFGNGAWGIPATLELADGRKVSVNLWMDLGYGDQLQIDPAGSNRLGVPERSLPGSLGFGAQGETMGSFGRVKGIEIGGYRMDNILSAFLQEDQGEDAGLEVMVGLGLLSRFNFIYDYPGHRMFVEPNRSFAEPFEYNMTGLSMRRTSGDVMEIVTVHPDSPASEAGMKVGDRVTRINGKAAVEWDVWELRPILTQEGTVVELVILRDGKPRPVSLTLRRLI